VLDLLYFTYVEQSVRAEGLADLLEVAVEVDDIPPEPGSGKKRE
jgi:hypothetical protein